MAPASLLLNLLAPILLLSHTTSAHGIAHHEPIKVDENADWATRHLAEEHHISNFDAGAFFQLHDFDNNGYWDFSELHSTYGFKDESTKDIAPERKSDAIHQVLGLMDRDKDGRVAKDEWFAFVTTGGKLPDFGMGPGHHGDDEYEYEIHHWEKFHDENTKEEDLTHPEDIAHFRKHEQMEAEAARMDALNSRSIVIENIPQMFRIIHG